MNLNSLIINTLSPTGVPVLPLTYSGDAIKYITFFEYNQMGVLYADDSEQNTRFSIQVDIWSKKTDDDNGNYKSLEKQVRTLMIKAGFTRNGEGEMYEQDTNTFHKYIRFYFAN